MPPTTHSGPIFVHSDEEIPDDQDAVDSTEEREQWMDMKHSGAICTRPQVIRLENLAMFLGPSRIPVVRERYVALYHLEWPEALLDKEVLDQHQRESLGSPICRWRVTSSPQSPISTRLHNRPHHVSSTSVPYSFNYIPVLYRPPVYAVVQKG